MVFVVEKSVAVEAPVTEVFNYIDDFRNAPEWLFGITRIDAVPGRPSQGVGAQVEGTMKLGVALHSRIECVEWERDAVIALRSVKGIVNDQRWTFTPISDDRCRVDAYITYELPGGPAGKAIGAAVKPFVGIAIDSTTKALMRKFDR